MLFTSCENTYMSCGDVKESIFKSQITSLSARNYTVSVGGQQQIMPCHHHDDTTKEDIISSFQLPRAI
jgi:hypothetical protein